MRQDSGIRKSSAAADEAIREGLQARLHGSRYLDQIVVQVEHGEVTLLGDVPHRRMRQQLVEAALSYPGVRAVHDKLNVPLVAPWPDFPDAPQPS
ncbi:MAG TPA: BON domain-containing protein [Burkholderiales bacterium]|nr:BON domain-containing protein [Burkholderiales bacterium]